MRQKKANGWGTGLIQIHTVKDLERNQSYRVLLIFVQGRRFLLVVSTLVLWFRDTSTLVPL